MAGFIPFREARNSDAFDRPGASHSGDLKHGKDNLFDGTILLHLWYDIICRSYNTAEVFGVSNNVTDVTASWLVWNRFGYLDQKLK